MSTIHQARTARAVRLTIVAAAAAVSAGVFVAPGTAAAAAPPRPGDKRCNEIRGVKVCVERLNDNDGLRVSVQNNSGKTIKAAQLRIWRSDRDDAVTNVSDLPNGWGRTGWIVSNNCLHATGVLKSSSLDPRYSPPIPCR